MANVVLANVSKQYPLRGHAVTALNNINFAVEHGAFLVLVGASGSGKSTILQLISGLEQPTIGQVVVDGQDLSKLAPEGLSAFRRQKIGIVFQQFYLEPTLCLRDNIELPAMFAGAGLEARQLRTIELARQIGLADHLWHRPAELSGGQIQRAAIARAIYNRPSILIADEPTSNLDPANAAAVVGLFQQIRQAYGTTIIIATHDQNLAQYATQTIKLSQGGIVA